MQAYGEAIESAWPCGARPRDWLDRRRGHVGDTKNRSKYMWIVSHTSNKWDRSDEASAIVMRAWARSRAVTSERRCVVADWWCRESEGKAKIEGYMSISDEEAHQRLHEGTPQPLSTPPTLELVRGLLEPNKKQHRADDYNDEELLECMSKQVDLGADKVLSGVTIAGTKQGDDPPKKIKLKFGLSSLGAVPSWISDASLETGAKDGASNCTSHLVGSPPISAFNTIVVPSHSHYIGAPFPLVLVVKCPPEHQFPRCLISAQGTWTIALACLGLSQVLHCTMRDDIVTWQVNQGALTVAVLDQ